MSSSKYGFDISMPASNAKEAIQWLYFAYLGATKDQNGAAMSLGRTSTFLDIYIENQIISETKQTEEVTEDEEELEIRRKNFYQIEGE
mgnify:CR=1 FL=1